MQPVRFPVKLPTVGRVFYIGVGILCLSMAADSAGADLKTQLLAWGFFGVGGVLVLKLMLRNSGWLIVREDGLLVDTHWSTGLIRWEHLQQPRAVRLLGLSHLGLNTSDPEGYLQSRSELRGLVNESDRAYAQGFFRGMVAMLTVLPPARMFVNIALPLCGWSPLPKSATEAAMLAWQGENYGAQITIPRLWIPDFERVLAELQSRARAVSRTEGAVPSEEPAQPRLHTPAMEPAPAPSDLKACPMCAESIQREARICRFCRYSFDEQRLLPSA